MNLPNALNILTPEIVLSGVAFLALILDIFALRKNPVEDRHKTLGKLVLIGLVVVGALYYLRYSAELSSSARVVIGNGAFVQSALNDFFKFIVIIVTFVTILIGLRTPYSAHVGEYYSMILLSVLGMVFLISSEDLLMIFVGIELISLTLYALTAFQKGARRSVEGGLKYFVFGGLSAAFLLFGLSYIFGATGHTSLAEIATAVSGGSIPFKLLNVGVLFTLVGLGFKVAAAPFHLWAPDAYEGAPTPIAALIATGSKIASFLVLTKLLEFGLLGAAGKALACICTWQSGWSIMVLMMAVASMVIGNFAAIGQRNVKRLLAYSSIAHAGYILVAMVAIQPNGIPSPSSLPAIYYYILIYSLTNIGAFGVINALASKAGGDDYEHFKGMSQRAPFLSVLLLVFLLSLAGIPPLAGFFGKFYLFAAAVQADPHNLGLLWLVTLAIAMSAVSLYYYLKLAKQIYVLNPDDKRQFVSNPGTCVTLGFVCLAIVLLGVFPSQTMDILDKANKGSMPATVEKTTAQLRLPTE